MSRLIWETSPRYEEGLSHAVLYSGDRGVTWNGLISVEEGASGTQDLTHYFDGRRLIITQEIGDFEASIQAFTYPEAFEEYDGFSVRQSLKRFGLSYRIRGSAGDKIHLIYNAWVRTPDRQWTTLRESVDLSTFRWDILATAVNIPGGRPASRLVVDTEMASPGLVSTLEDWLYGTETEDPRLPDPEELVDIFEAETTLRITQNGDGTYTASGPDSVIQLNVDGSFDISAPTVLFIDSGV